MDKLAFIGIGWFERDDYPRILEIMEDGNALPRIYDDWQPRAERKEREFAAMYERPTTRVIIKPDKFAAWCSTKRTKLDSYARELFVAEVAMKRRDK